MDAPREAPLDVATLQDKVAAMQEEIDLMRARAPRAFILARKAEWVRLFREVHSFLRVCHNKHGTDWRGRKHAMDALIEAMKYMEADDAARETILDMLREAELNGRSPAPSSIGQQDTKGGEG